MNNVINLYKKYQEIINYLIVGVLTTVVSIVTYFLFSLILDIENNILFILANVLSWICAVIFAYITNKKFVFNTTTSNKKEEINALEYLAKENYEITLQDFEGYGEVRTPYKTFRNTIEKPLSAPLPSESSSNFLYYRHGCYIHLTDTGIDEYLKIKWGEIEDETN